MSLGVHFEIVDTKQLDVEQKKEMISFTQMVSMAGDGYLYSRFEVYDYVICLRRNQKLFAFQLVQTFEQSDDRFVYFGPLFSRMSCFLALFMNYLQVVMDENQGRNVHLLVEIENPEVLLLFKALFEDYAYPTFQEHWLPDEVKEKVLVYSKTLSHINDIDVEHLTTKSIDSLYQEKPIHPEVANWLHSREINLSRGMNILLYSHIPNEPHARKEFETQLERGRNRMDNWKEGKKEVLFLFKRGIVSNV